MTVNPLTIEDWQRRVEERNEAARQHDVEHPHQDYQHQPVEGTVIETAARLALFTLHGAEAKKRETRASRGARARTNHARQLVKNLLKQIDRLPASDYPCGRELRDARDNAKAALREWQDRFLAPLEHVYEPGLIVAPILLPKSTGGAPPKRWLEYAGRAALDETPTVVAQKILLIWREYATLPSSHPNRCSTDDLCTLLRVPPAQRQWAVSGDLKEVAREFLTDRIAKAAYRQKRKKAALR